MLHHISFPSNVQAFPGVLIGTGAIAVLMRYSFPYDWSWTEALLFGAMMAATDPVATVAVLGQVWRHPVTCCYMVEPDINHHGGLVQVFRQYAPE